MRHSNRRKRQRRRKQIAKSASIATMSLLSFSLAGGAAADRSLFIFDKEMSRVPGLRLAQTKQTGRRARGVRAGRAGTVAPDKKRMGVKSAPPMYMQAAPAFEPASKPAKPTK
jgi:hypothetical protein